MFFLHQKKIKLVYVVGFFLNKDFTSIGNNYTCSDLRYLFSNLNYDMPVSILGMIFFFGSGIGDYDDDFVVLLKTYKYLV